MPTTAKRFENTSNDSERLFDNQFLERLTRTRTAVPIILFFTISGILLCWGYTREVMSVITLIETFLIGWLTFSLIEYIVHRYVFHMATNTSSRVTIQYKVHGIHHDYPKDKERLAMPPVLSLTISIILFFIFRALMGGAAFGFLPGFLIGYALYLYVHYAIHAYQPPKNFLKILWVNHGIHHYKDHDRAFGVSTPLWDYIFGTMPKRKQP